MINIAKVFLRKSAKIESLLGLLLCHIFRHRAFWLLCGLLSLAFGVIWFTLVQREGQALYLEVSLSSPNQGYAFVRNADRVREGSPLDRPILVVPSAEPVRYRIPLPGREGGELALIPLTEWVEVNMIPHGISDAHGEMQQILSPEDFTPAERNVEVAGEENRLQIALKEGDFYGYLTFQSHGVASPSGFFRLYGGLMEFRLVRPCLV